jgi:outer membrane protein
MTYAKWKMAAVMSALAVTGSALADGVPDRRGIVLAPVEPAANFQVKIGASGVLWQDSNKGIESSVLGHLAGASAHLDDIWLPTAALTYYLSRNVAAELFCCFAHANVYGTGTLRGLGQDKIADTWAFPPALTLQYHFNRIGPARPYVGAGVQWIHYFDSDSDLRGALGGYDRVSFRDSWGPIIQGGLDFDLGRGWSIGLDVKYAWLDTRIGWRDGAGNTLVTRHDIDPLLVTANIGYRFNLGDLLGPAFR